MMEVLPAIALVLAAGALVFMAGWSARGLYNARPGDELRNWAPVLGTADKAVIDESIIRASCRLYVPEPHGPGLRHRRAR